MEYKLNQFISESGITRIFEVDYNSVVVPISGGTFSGSVNVEGALSANTLITDTLNLSALTSSTITVDNYVDFSTDKTSPSSLPGRLFYDKNEEALSYFPSTPNMDVIINIGQEELIRVYNNSGEKILNGQVCFINGAYTGGTPTIELACSSGSTNLLVNNHAKISGVATHDIDDGAHGFITNHGIVRNLTITGVSEGTSIFLSDIEPGGYKYSIEDLLVSSRVCRVGTVVKTGVTTAKILVEIDNEQLLTELSTRQNQNLTFNNTATSSILFDGFSITDGDNTKFNIGRVKGWVIDNITNPEYPTVTYVDYSGSTGNTTPYLTTHPVTYIAIDKENNIIKSSTPFTNAQKRDYIDLGVIVHTNLTNINTFNNLPVVGVDTILQLYDLMNSIGFFNVNGNIYSNNGANLTIKKSSGVIFKQGSNFTIDPKNPHTKSMPSTIPTTFRYRIRSGEVTGDITNINPNYYDNNGVLTPVGNNKFSVQRIYLFPSNLTRIQYGQYQYATMAEAIAAISNESFVTESNLAENGLLRGFLVLKQGISDLSNTSNAKFINANRFGDVSDIGGGISTGTLQTAYDNSVQPEILTNDTRGAVDIRNGQSTETANVLTIQDTSSNIRAYFKGNGAFSAFSIDALTIYSGGTNLLDIFTGSTPNNYYTTGATLYDKIIYFDRNDTLSAYTVDLSSFTLNNEFIGHTGNTSIHYPMSSITLSKLGSSAHTHTINDITDLTANFIAKTGGTITGSLTINSNLTVNGNSVFNIISATTFYGDGSHLSGISTDNYYTTGATLYDKIIYFDRNDTLSAYTLNLNTFAYQQDLNLHTGNTSIHYPISSITLSELGSSAHTHPISAITNLQTELDNTFVFKSGDTFTGNVYAPLFSGTNINGVNILSGGTNIKTLFASIDSDISYFPVDINRFGFVNHTDTKISFNGVNTFTLSGTTWEYYRAGKKYTINGSKSIQVASPMVNGTLYYIYINGTNGDLVSSTSLWSLAPNSTIVPVATLYYNTGTTSVPTGTTTMNYVLAEERHTCLIDRQTHNYKHLSIGTKLLYGCEITGYILNSTVATNKVFGVTEAKIADEDIFLTLSSKPKPDGATPAYYVWYRTSTSTWSWVYSDMPFKYTSLSPTTYNFIEYDNNGVSTPSTGNRYVNTYLVLTNNISNNDTNDISTGNFRFVIVQGRGSYNTAALAYGEAFGSFDLTGFPVAEAVAVYQITWQTQNYNNTIKGRCAINRVQKITSNIVTTSATTIGIHNTLAGLQGGTANEYYHLTDNQFNVLTTGGTASSLHHHDDKYVELSGDTMTGSLSINSNLTVNGNISLKTNTITAITDTILSASTNYEIPTTKAVYDYITNNNFNKITVTFDGCYTYIPTNTMAKTMADGNYNIIAWKIVGNNQTNSGCTASIDVLINGVSAVGSGNKPSLTNATANYATISGWTTTVINENDIIGLNIASNNDATYLNVVIITRKNN